MYLCLRLLKLAICLGRTLRIMRNRFMFFPRVVSIVIAIVLLLTSTAALHAAAPTAKAFAPDEEAQAHALKAVRDIFATESADAKTNAQKQALAKKLMQNGRETKNDLAG